MKFEITGNIRFLSHSEMLRMFQRTLSRAKMPVKYSSGFNPRPKISLPFPRPVGVESEQDLLYFQLTPEKTGKSDDLESKKLKEALQKQIPQAIKILSLDFVKGKPLLQPISVTYEFRIRPDNLNAKTKNSIIKLMDTERIVLQRRKNEKTEPRPVEVRRFLDEINIDDKDKIMVRCNVSPDGTIRVDEIMALLELNQDDLTAPIRRTQIQWKET